MYDTRADLLAGTGRLPAYPKDGAQVEVSRIDRAISSGASYAMKYLLKTVDGGDELSREVGLFAAPEGESGCAKMDKREQHRETARRVDAFRSLWGINAGQLFGVAKCLTAWDELRRLAKAPRHPELRRLWALARGSEVEGRIAAGSGQRGDAKGFILALGGLAACGKPAKGTPRRGIGRLTDAGVNAYGEPIERTKGVTLVERTRKQVAVGLRANRTTGELTTKQAWRAVKTVVAQVRTRLTEWILAPTKKASSARPPVRARLAAATGAIAPA
jgi:hypothetical protein